VNPVLLTLQDFLSRRLFTLGDTDVTVSSILVSLGILVGSWVLAGFTRRVIADRLLGRTQLDPGVRYALGRVLGYVILALGAIIAVQSLGVPTETLAVFGGALGVGLGFGLQDLVKNFAAGLVLLIDRSVKVGDVVEIRARATIVRTNDDIHLVVPNANLISDTIVNWTYRGSEVRLKIPVGVATDSDPRAVEAALLEAAAGIPGVLTAPSPKSGSAATASSRWTSSSSAGLPTWRTGRGRSRATSTSGSTRPSRPPES